MRMFLADAITRCSIVGDASAIELDVEKMRRFTQSSYGMVAGIPKAWD